MDAATVVSLNPCTDAILSEIAAPGQLLAISHYSQNKRSSSMPLDVAASYRTTGGSAEEVLALAPDMVVADVFLAPATRHALEQAGIEIVTVGIPSSLDHSVGQIALLGEATGNTARADALVQEVTVAWDSHEWTGQPISALLLQEGDIVAGQGSLAHALLIQAGFSSLSAARGLGQGAHLPLEHVLAEPPQVVITAGGGRMQQHPALGAIPGMQHHLFDPTLLYCGGPTIPRALDRLTEIRRSAQ